MIVIFFIIIVARLLAVEGCHPGGPRPFVSKAHVPTCLVGYNLVQGALKKVHPTTAGLEEVNNLCKQFPGYKAKWRGLPLTAQEKKLCGPNAKVPIEFSTKQKYTLDVKNNGVTTSVHVTPEFSHGLTTDSILLFDTATGHIENSVANLLQPCALCEIADRVPDPEKINLFAETIGGGLHPSPPAYIDRYNWYDIIVTENNVVVDKNDTYNSHNILFDLIEALTVTNHSLIWKKTVKKQYSQDFYFRYRQNLTETFHGVHGSNYHVNRWYKVPTTCQPTSSRYGNRTLYWDETPAGHVSHYIFGELIVAKECFWDVDELPKWAAPFSWTMNLVVYDGINTCDRDHENKGIDYWYKDMLWMLHLQLLNQSRFSPSNIMESGDMFYRYWWTIRNNSFNEALHFTKQKTWPIIEKIQDGVILNSSTDFEYVTDTYSNYFMVANTTFPNPVLGIIGYYNEIFHTLSTFSEIRSKACEQSNVTKIRLTVSDGFMQSYTRMTLGVFLDKGSIGDFKNQGWKDKKVFSYMGHVVMSNPSHSVAKDDSYFQVAIDNHLNVGHMKAQCTTYKIAEEQWSTDDCKTSTSECGTIFRCSNLNSDSNSVRSYFAIYFTNVTLAYYLKENIGLAVVLGFDLIFFVIGVGGVAVYCIMSYTWMVEEAYIVSWVLAICLNMCFSFGNGFLNEEKNQVACVAVGVLRHVSYVSMFSWMFALSCLRVSRLHPNTEFMRVFKQYKMKLETVGKVSSFAWGAGGIGPAVGVFLKTFTLYRSYILNRGYCYPELDNFKLFVQYPAGIILLMNLVPCFKLWYHYIVRCRKNTKVKFRNNSEKAFLRKNMLMAIIMWIAMWVTWGLHWGDYYVMQQGHLYEVLYLMTLSVHVFVIFVVLVVMHKPCLPEELDPPTEDQKVE